MEDKKYRICDYFNDDFKDKTAIDNYEGVAYDQALDIIDQMFSSPDWKINKYDYFDISFQPFEIEKNGMNISKKPLIINQYVCEIIKNILVDLGIKNVEYNYNFEFDIQIPISEFKNVLGNYYNLLQAFEYNKKTEDGIYPYDNDLNKLANKILNVFFGMDTTCIKNHDMVYVLQNHDKNVHYTYEGMPIGANIDLSKEDFNLLFKILKCKINSLSSKDIALSKTFDDNFFLMCPCQEIYNLRDVYDEERTSHVLKK